MGIYSRNKGWLSLLFGVQLVLVGALLLLGYQPSRGFNYIFLVSVLLAVGLSMACYAVWRSGIRAIQAIDEKTNELDFSNDSLARCEARLEEIRVERQAQEREEREVRVVKEKAKEQLQGGTVQELSESFFHMVSARFQTVQGVYYAPDGPTRYSKTAGYAYFSEHEPLEGFARGETLSGQVAQEGTFLYLDELPKGFRVIRSGLGKAAPSLVAIFALRGPGEKVDLGVLELCFFVPCKAHDKEVLEGMVAEFCARLEDLMKRGK